MAGTGIPAGGGDKMNFDDVNQILEVILEVKEVIWKWEGSDEETKGKWKLFGKEVGFQWKGNPLEVDWKSNGSESGS